MKMKLKHFKLYYRIRIMCRHSLGRKLKRGRIDLLQLNTMKCNDQNRNNECHTFAQSMQLFNIFWLKTINNCFISVVVVFQLLSSWMWFMRCDCIRMHSILWSLNIVRVSDFRSPTSRIICGNGSCARWLTEWNLIHVR